MFDQSHKSKIWETYCWLQGIIYVANCIRYSTFHIFLSESKWITPACGLLTDCEDVDPDRFVFIIAEMQIFEFFYQIDDCRY